MKKFYIIISFVFIFFAEAVANDCDNFLQVKANYTNNNKYIEFEFKSSSPDKTIKILEYGLLNKSGRYMIKGPRHVYVSPYKIRKREIYVGDLNLNFAGKFRYTCTYGKPGKSGLTKFREAEAKKFKFKFWHFVVAILVGIWLLASYSERNNYFSETNIKKRKPRENSDKKDNVGPRMTGTAFFIDKKGHLITNYHVIADCGNRLRVLFENVEKKAKIIGIDKTLDLALIKINSKNKSNINISDETLSKMQSIVAAGFPALHLSDDLKLTSGIISSLKGIGNNSALIQIDAALNPGNSGGPIIDKENGNLAAVAVARMEGSEYQSINYGIKSSRVKEFIESNRISIPKEKEKKKKIKRKELANLLESSTVLVYH